jgi:DNA-binding NtrC family response regulator
MPLVADRFVIQDDGCAWDLATAARVSLTIASAGGPADQRRWLLRCDALSRVRHCALASLVDFGLLGAAGRFEAWQCGAPWRGAADDATRAQRLVAQFMGTAGLTTGEHSVGTVHHGEGGAVIVPSGDVGFPALEGVGAPDSDGGSSGVAIIDRVPVAAIADSLASDAEPRARAIALWGPPESGKRTAVLLLARTARLHGLVPVHARVVQSAVADAVRDRSLLVIDDGCGRPGWSALLTATLRSALSHVWLRVCTDEVRGVDSVFLGPLSAEALVQAVRPRPASARAEDRIRRLAERSQGLPGRFVRSLWGMRTFDRRPRSNRQPCVAERMATYGSEPAETQTMKLEPTAVLLESSASHQWSTPSELAALRRRMEAAIALLNAGRHAPGHRLLRQAVGGLARREAWYDATTGCLRLAMALMRRGRAREAQGVIDEAGRYASRGPSPSLLIDVGMLMGETWTDLGRLDEAERVLSGALAAARASGDSPRVCSASIGLARCLFWRGQYVEAVAAAEAAEPVGARLDARESVRRVRMIARAAAALGESARAMAALDAARNLAAASGDSARQGEVDCSAAFVHLTVGDLESAERDATASIAGARAARQPVRVLAARLLQLEAVRRRQPSSMRGRLHALRRVAMTMPPILRTRWELLDALASSDAPDPVVDRHVAASGLKALALFGTALRPRWGGGLGMDPFVEEIVALLRVCQVADDEPAVLSEVCARVRQQLRAASVAFVGIVDAGRRHEVVACDGPRIDTELAERAVHAGITIGPIRHQERIHAAAVVRYGGETIGSLCARWNLGSTHDLARAPAVLSLAATAAAPMLGALRLGREGAATPGTVELLGVTSVMGELRRSVERAAAAPFAVLIEGESGSGKELVARAIHRLGPRRNRPFCTLNCAALPDDLVEAELFGHARGSFTGAVAERRGVFEDADGGSLLLDEIGELSLRAQAKVLRVIQEGELRRVGENVTRRVDVRIVSATNRDLRREVEAGRFRLDLLYRLDVVRITVPSLRERKEDVPLLVDHFWSDAIGRVGSRALLSSAARAALAGYDWPGNVRELQNVLAALAVRSPKRGVVPPTALPTHLVGSRRPDVWRLQAARRTFEEGFVRATLVRVGGHRGRAAAELGVTRQGLARLMSRLGIGS